MASPPSWAAVCVCGARWEKARAWTCGSPSVATGTLNRHRPQTAARRGGLALMVDDEPLVRATAAAMLDDLGFRVLEAGSTDEAMRELESRSDIGLPVTDHLMSSGHGRRAGAHGLLALARPWHPGCVRIPRGGQPARLCAAAKPSARANWRPVLLPRGAARPPRNPSAAAPGHGPGRPGSSSPRRPVDWTGRWSCVPRPVPIHGAPDRPARARRQCVMVCAARVPLS